MKNCEPEKFDGHIPETPKIENVGETFMSWAEKNWALEKLITTGMRINENDNCESCPYYVMRDIFVHKINELVKNKV